MEKLLLASILMLNFGLWPTPNRVIDADKLASQQGLMINLPVYPLKQLKLTSCGEAVIAMAYHFAYPKTSLDERVILTYAEMQGYYTEKKWPFTSPANMVRLTEHYTKDISSGAVSSAEQGLALLMSNLQSGTPVVIDILTRLDDPRSGAHFVLVTGLHIPADNKYAVTVYYNDPNTGTNRSSPWYGDGGVWSAWRHNGDPGGAGWWLSIQEPMLDLP